MDKAPEINAPGDSGLSSRIKQPSKSGINKKSRVPECEMNMPGLSVINAPKDTAKGPREIGINTAGKQGINQGEVGRRTRMSACPICNEMVEGEEGGPEINAHVDTCLRYQC